MKHSTKFISMAALIGLGACTATPSVFEPLASVPSVGTAAQDAATNTYSVTVGGTTTDLALISSFGTTKVFTDIANTYYARGFQNADTLVVGGFTQGAARTPFAGVSGTLSPVQTSGSATFNGDITFVYPSPISTTLADYRWRTLQLNADFAAGTIGQIFDGVTISGTITGCTFSGTVDWSGKSAPLAGGFFGTNTAAGAFSSADMAGAFLGTNP